MPDLSSGAEYGAEGAQIGSAFGPLGTGVGAGIGFLGGLFGGSNPEDVNNERFQQFLTILARMKKDTINTTAQRNSGFLEQATANARKRAAAAGLSGSDVEANILPAQGSAARSASEALNNAIQPFNQAEINATAQYEGRPIQPNALDYVAEFGGSLAKQMNFDKYLDVVRGKNVQIPVNIANMPGQTNPRPNYYTNPGLDYRNNPQDDYLNDIFK